jgi:hypothetical protein
LSRTVIPHNISGFETTFSPDDIKIADGLAGQLNGFSVSCLTTVVRYTIDAEDENKEVGTVLKLFHKNLGTSVLLVCVFLLILFHNFFIISVIVRTT